MVQEQRAQDGSDSQGHSELDSKKRFELFQKLKSLKISRDFMSAVKLMVKVNQIKAKDLKFVEENQMMQSKVEKQKKRVNIITKSTTVVGKRAETMKIFGDTYLNLRQELMNFGADKELTSARFTELQKVAGRKVFKMMRQGKPREEVLDELYIIAEGFLRQERREKRKKEKH